MPLTTGFRLGPYEVLSPLGRGGMGEVYRARDSKLNRDVALKVLPDAFTLDVERLGRFMREAQVLASLNHPNIAAIYGIEEGQVRQTGPAGQVGRIEINALVLELVEGPTLADQIALGPIPLAEALPIARQIALAIETAHEQGIIHRDLKPANIKLRPDGVVKVLDFGLAKAMEPAGAMSPGVSQSPTITTPAMTQAGTILGTAAYMSPEQAKGHAGDKRSDMWAFGCVLYEMLTGKRAFDGDDVSDTLAAVLRSEPDWSALSSNQPYAVRALVQGCLRKDRRERIGDMSTALFLLNPSPGAAPDVSASRPLTRSVWKQAAWVLASLLIGTGAATTILWKPKPMPAGTVTGFVIALPQGQQLALPRQAVAISPDSSRIVYAADGKLFVRTMSEIEPRAIPGSDRAWHPVFSPDGQSLLFWADSALKRIPIGGGTAFTICRSDSAPSGIFWGNDAILFAQFGIGIMRVSPNGGKPEVVVGASDSEALVHGPQLLPDGVTLLFTIAPRASVRTAVSDTDIWDKAQVVVQSLKTGKRKILVEGGGDGRYVPTGHIVYAVGGTLFAVPFDVAQLAVTGEAVPVVEGVRRAIGVGIGSAHFAFSNSGSLVYVPGPVSGGQQGLFLFDRTGGGQALKLPPGPYAYPRISPDGKRIAFETSDGKDTNVSIYDLTGASSARRLTFGGNNRFPIWSADGQRVVFQSDREHDPALFWQPADGGNADRLTKPDPGTSHVPESSSPAGDAVLFSVTKGSEISLWTYSLRDRRATPFDDVRSTTYPTDAVFSPDGRWVAYQTSQSGQGEGTTYVQPFPPNGTIHEIARGGRPQWSRDGTELFYTPAPNLFMAVTVNPRPTFTITAPHTIPRGFTLSDPSNPRPYDITPDGRILAVGIAGQDQNGAPATPPIHVVLNWSEELKQRVPTK